MEPQRRVLHLPPIQYGAPHTGNSRWAFRLLCTGLTYYIQYGTNQMRKKKKKRQQRRRRVKIFFFLLITSPLPGFFYRLGYTGLMSQVLRLVFCTIQGTWDGTACCASTEVDQWFSSRFLLWLFAVIKRLITRSGRGSRGSRGRVKSIRDKHILYKCTEAIKSIESRVWETLEEDEKDSEMHLSSHFSTRTHPQGVLTSKYYCWS